MVVRHSVTVDAGFSTTYQQNIGSIYIDPGTSLTLNTAWPGRTTGSHVIEVCGTLNIKSGNSNFSKHTLQVNNGGVVNVDGGELEIDKIIVKNGGTINFNGGALRRACGSAAAVGLTVEDGGLININNSTSALNITSSCFGEPYTVLDGTIDCKNTLSTSTIASRFRLGYCRVTNSTSTGRMRTQTQYTPSIDWQTTTLPYSSRSANGNFTGYNSTYGGLVEYYGSSNITLDNSALQSLYQYYNLEVNMTGGAELRLGKANIFDVVGVLYLTSGNLNLNDRHLRLRGNIIYGTGALKGTSSSTLTMVGKLSGASADFVSSGMTTFQIWAKSKAASANVNCLNPELRFASGSRTLGTLEINREDVVHLTTDLTVATKLRLEDGILNTRNIILHVTATDSAAVEHATTGTSLSSWISGNLRRSVVPGVNYDYPVGRQNIGTVGGSTNAYPANVLNYRRYMLELGTATGMSYVDVNFEHPTATCEGSMPVISEGGLEYIQVHPEGHWNVEPNGGTGINYNARLYVQGFQTGPELIDNEFGGLKRPDGGVCADWSTAGGTRPANGQPGRVVQAINASMATGYAKRIGWISFSDQAIGVAGGDPILSRDGTFRLQLLKQDAGLQLAWPSLQDQVVSYDLYVGHEKPNQPLTSATACESGCQYLHTPTAPGIYYYQVHARLADGRVMATNTVRSLWQAKPTLQPNPIAVGDAWQLTLATDSPAQLTLRNLLGQTVWQHTAQSTQMDVPAPGMPGTYLLQVAQDGQVYTHRLLVR
jgi:hypothetical protein